MWPSEGTWRKVRPIRQTTRGGRKMEREAKVTGNLDELEATLHRCKIFWRQLDPRLLEVPCVEVWDPEFSRECDGVEGGGSTQNGNNVSRATRVTSGWRTSEREGNLINSFLDKLPPVRPLGNTQRSGPRIPMSSSKAQPEVPHTVKSGLSYSLQN